MFDAGKDESCAPLLGLAADCVAVRRERKDGAWAEQGGCVCKGGGEAEDRGARAKTVVHQGRMTREGRRDRKEKSEPNLAARTVARAHENARCMHTRTRAHGTRVHITCWRLVDGVCV
jgi:hypothetical protein